jgi:hypothetical protein
MQLNHPVRPPKASGRKPGALHPDSWNKLLDYLYWLESVVQRITPSSSPDILPKSGPGGTSYLLARRGGGGSAPKPPCPFGTLISTTTASEEPVTTYHLLGGAVTAGTGVWDVENYEIDVSEDGFFLLWVDTDVVANTSSGLILPGLASSTQSTIGQGASYPSQVLPTVASEGAGTSIVPLGYVVIEAGKPTLYPSGCGSIIIQHCPGSLTYSRV